MGYESQRFNDAVDEELLCSICSLVLENPVQVSFCEHAFCKQCIHEWIRINPTCPVDRQPLSNSQLVPVPRILKNMLGRQMILCDNSIYGCEARVRLDCLHQHKSECEHNPSRLVLCQKGCGLKIPMNILQDHNCLQELRDMVQNQNFCLTALTAKLNEQQSMLEQQKLEVDILKEAVSVWRGSSSPETDDRLVAQRNSVNHGGGTDWEQVLLRQWSQTLPLAKITRWGGLISTPDTVLQAVIKRSLRDAGCPPNVLHSLVERSHERHWPASLSSLEVRQLQRRQCEQFVCRRVPGKQAVVVLTCDNTRVFPDLLCEPGLVLIFAHGVE